MSTEKRNTEQNDPTSLDVPHERALVERLLSSSALSPPVIAAVLAELQHISDHCALESYWFERIFANGGLALAGANAARRAHQRLGSVWPLIEYLEQFLAPHAPADRANEARLVLARARQGEAAFEGVEYDDRYDAAAQSGAESEEPALARCLAKVELLACDTIHSGHIEYDVAYEVFQIVHVLATEVSSSAAQELVAGLEALGTEQP
jgi:hypothetical protein